MFLIFTLGRLDILPTGDLGIRKAVMLKLPVKKNADRRKGQKYC